MECVARDRPALERGNAMSDMSQVIQPKSDQINADDLIAGPMTIKITDVKVQGGQEQPVSIHFAGSGKVYRPCKSMSRVLVAAWGADAKNYVGRSLTLYRDPKVKWGGMEVGGIRISHMTHIERDMTMMLTMTKQNRAPHKVKVLHGQQEQQRQDPPTDSAPQETNAADAALLSRAKQQAGYGKSAFTEFWQGLSPASRDVVRTIMSECQAIATKADADNAARDADPFGLPPVDGDGAEQ